eukprot:Skav212637  [mRNA]  locus=scaffold173:401992:408747:+ [translate_table: standard]
MSKGGQGKGAANVRPAARGVAGSSGDRFPSREADLASTGGPAVGIAGAGPSAGACSSARRRRSEERKARVMGSMNG